MKSKSKILMIVLLCIALAMTFSFTGSVFAEEGQPATTESSTAVENSAQTENAPAAGTDQGQTGITGVSNKGGSESTPADTENTEAVEEKAASEEKTVETPKSDESASETKDNGSASKGEESSDVKTPDVSKLTELLRSVSSKIGPLKAAYFYGRSVEGDPASQEEVDEAIAIVSKTITEYNELNRLKSRATALKIDVNNVDTFLKENSVRINGVFIQEKEKRKEAALIVNEKMPGVTHQLQEAVEKAEKEAEERRAAIKEQLEREKKELPEFAVNVGKERAVFTLHYVIRKDYDSKIFTFDPYSDFFRIAVLYGLENWVNNGKGRVLQYYPAMPGDRNYVVVKITNESGKKFYYKNGGFGLSIASDGTVVPDGLDETKFDFYDLASLAFSKTDIEEQVLISEGNVINSERTVNSYKKGGRNVPVTEELLQTLFGKDSDTSTWGETGCTLFSGFALDGPRITNDNAYKSFGWSTPITLVRDADPIPVPTKTIRVSKVWVTDDGGTPAESVDVQILKNGEAYKVVTLSDANGWNYSEAVIDDGAKYTAQEVTSVDGFVSSVTEDGDTITITNDDVKKPDKPDKPDKPTKPDKPVKPTKPDKPAKPSKPAKPKKPAVSVPVEQVKANVPKTGDENHMGLYGGMLVLAAAGAAVLLRLRRKSGK